MKYSISNQAYTPGKCIAFRSSSVSSSISKQISLFSICIRQSYCCNNAARSARNARSLPVSFLSISQFFRYHRLYGFSFRIQYPDYLWGLFIITQQLRAKLCQCHMSHACRFQTIPFEAHRQADGRSAHFKHLHKVSISFTLLFRIFPFYFLHTINGLIVRLLSFFLVMGLFLFLPCQVSFINRPFSFSYSPLWLLFLCAFFCFFVRCKRLT